MQEPSALELLSLKLFPAAGEGALQRYPPAWHHYVAHWRRPRAEAHGV